MEKSGELFFIYQKGGVEVEKGGENRIVSAKVLELVTLVLQEPTGAPAVGWARKPSPNRRSTPIERRRDPNREGFGMTRSGLCGLPPDAAADVARIVKAKHTDANVHARYNWGSLAPATVNLFTGPGSQPHRKVADMWRWLLKNEHGDWRAALGGIERSSASRPPPPPPPPPPVDHQIRELEQALRERERDMLAREQQERQLRQQLHDACRERDDSRREREIKSLHRFGSSSTFQFATIAHANNTSRRCECDNVPYMISFITLKHVSNNWWSHCLRL